MAVADAVLPLPNPRPAAAARNIVPWLARSRLAAAAADAVVCLFLASMWLLFGGAVASDIGRLACGEECAVVVAAYKAVAVAAVTLALVVPVAVMLLMARAAEAASDTETEKAHDPRSFAAAAREALRDPVMLGLLASMAFVLLVLVGGLLKGYSPVKGSCRERVGSVISDVGALGIPFWH